MRHFFIAHSDYASSGMLFARALESVGEEVRTLAWKYQRRFQYPVQMKRFVDSGRFVKYALESICWADCITVVQSELPKPIVHRFPLQPAMQMPFPWRGLLEKKKVVLTHGGSYYRQNKGRYRYYWRGIADAHICHSADLMGVFEREYLFLPPADPVLTPIPRNHSRLVVGHFPSRPCDKGSDLILPIVSEFDVEFRHNISDPKAKRGGHRVVWSEQVKRMAECDVIIDQIYPEENGQRLGEWCSISIEAAALGCVVITNSHNPEPYVKTYGRMPGIRICNDGNELRAEMRRLKSLSREQIREEQNEMRRWIEECHTLRSTGKRLMDRVYGDL